MCIQLCHAHCTHCAWSTRFCLAIRQRSEHYVIGLVFVLFVFLTTAQLGINSRDKKSLEAANEVVPRKRLTSLLKQALDLMARIWAEREFYNWAEDGRNDLAWPTKSDLGTSTARSWDFTDLCNLGSCTWMSGISWHNNSCRTYYRQITVCEAMHAIFHSNFAMYIVRRYYIKAVWVSWICLDWLLGQLILLRSTSKANIQCKEVSLYLVLFKTMLWLTSSVVKQLVQSATHPHSWCLLT